MTTTRSALTSSDIRLLVRSAEPEERGGAALRLCTELAQAPLTGAEREEAQAVLRLMARDAAEQVRRALATTLRASPLVPRDVANRLARDLEDIAAPVLAFSPVFTDDDLAEIARVGGPVRQRAIAQRPALSEKVTAVFAEHGEADSMRLACANPGAHFSEPSLQRAIDRFEASEGVLAAIALRQALPAAIGERLLALVAGEVRDELVARRGLSPELALTVAIGARERASLDLVQQAARAADLPAFVGHLRRGQRLTPSLLLRALAHGQMSFFEWSLAELSGVPHHRAWLMVHDAGPLGLRAIYERAGLPTRLLPAFRAAVDAYHSIESDQEDLARFQRRLLQRFLSQPQAMSRDDVDYLLDAIDQLSPPDDAADAAA